jgi:hypothetical protein
VEVDTAIDSRAVMAMEHTDTEAAKEEHDEVDLLVVREVGETEDLAVEDVRLQLVAVTYLSEDLLEVHLNG